TFPSRGSPPPVLVLARATSGYRVCNRRAQYCCAVTLAGAGAATPGRVRVPAQAAFWRVPTAPPSAATAVRDTRWGVRRPAPPPPASRRHAGPPGHPLLLH